MDKTKLAKLEAAGWKEVTVQEFLGLSNAESDFIEIKVRLAKALREKRAAQSLTQTAAAKILGSSQSRVAKMEAADSTVTLDLLVQSILSLGADRGEIARAIAPQPEAAALPEQATPVTVYTSRFALPKPYKMQVPTGVSNLNSLANGRTANGLPA